MIFLSKHAGYIFQVRDPIYNYNVPQGMPPIQMRPSLEADFGAAGGQVLMSPEWTEDDLTHAVIRGGVFDSDEAAGRLGWKDEERQLVEEKMLRFLDDPRFVDFSLYEDPVPVAPWPTYDQAHHLKVAGLAAELGLLVEALAYERSTKNRDGVVKALEEKLQADQVEGSLAAA